MTCLLQIEAWPCLCVSKCISPSFFSLSLPPGLSQDSWAGPPGGLLSSQAVFCLNLFYWAVSGLSGGAQASLQLWHMDSVVTVHGLSDSLLCLLKRVLNPSCSKIWASGSHGACLFQEVSLVTYELLCWGWRKRSECQAGRGRPFWKLNSWVCSVYCIIQGCLEIRFMAFLANVKIASKADHLTPRWRAGWRWPSLCSEPLCLILLALALQDAVVCSNGGTALPHGPLPRPQASTLWSLLVAFVRCCCLNIENIVSKVLCSLHVSAAPCGCWNSLRCIKPQKLDGCCT